MATELLPDQAELKRLEETIERHLASVAEIGRALKAIKDGALYLCSYRTFEEYVQDRWNFSRRTAYRYIEEVVPKKAIPNPTPATECEDGQSLCQNDTKIPQLNTDEEEPASSDLAAQDDILRDDEEPPPEKGPRDAAGVLIPETLRSVFKLGERFRAIQAHASRIYEEGLELKRAGLLMDHHFKEVRHFCKVLVGMATNGEPKYVCDACNGKGFDECGSCEGKGYLTHIMARTR